MSDELVTCPHCGRRNRVPAAAEVVAPQPGALPPPALRAWVDEAIRE
jgi:hypothetical protein